MTAVIEIRGLRVLAAHGALEEERGRAQPFELDIDVSIDADRAAVSDDLEDTIDYGRLVRIAGEVMSGAPHALLESLAGDVVTALVGVEGVLEATVTVRKLRPPIPAHLESVAVRLTRTAAR